MYELVHFAHKFTEHPAENRIKPKLEFLFTIFCSTLIEVGEAFISTN